MAEDMMKNIQETITSMKNKVVNREDLTEEEADMYSAIQNNQSNVKDWGSAITCVNPKSMTNTYAFIIAGTPNPKKSQQPRRTAVDELNLAISSVSQGKPSDSNVKQTHARNEILNPKAQTFVPDKKNQTNTSLLSEVNKRMLAISIERECKAALVHLRPDHLKTKSLMV